MKQKYAITIGTFDGVHNGHRYLLNRLESIAAHYLLKPLVLYFPFPPKTLLSNHPEMTLLTLPQEKKQLFKQYGVNTLPLDFNACRDCDPSRFWKQLKTNYHMGAMVVGADFAFGKDRQGTVSFLREQCRREQIPFHVENFYQNDHQKISSSLIRKTLALGNVPLATQLLGHPYELSGMVIKGHRLGRKLGFPTANLDTGIYKILPLGVFAVKVRVGKKFYGGFCNIGFRPTVNTLHTLLPLVEVHIFDFHKSIYGRKITIWFIEKLRDETKFTTLDALKTQLHNDRALAQQILKKLK